MFFIYTGIGAVVLGVGAGAVWGLVLFIELLMHALGQDVLQYLLPAPVIFILCYLVGHGVHEYRRGTKRTAPVLRKV